MTVSKCRSSWSVWLNCFLERLWRFTLSWPVSESTLFFPWLELNIIYFEIFAIFTGKKRISVVSSATLLMRSHIWYLIRASLLENCMWILEFLRTDVENWKSEMEAMKGKGSCSTAVHLRASLKPQNLTLFFWISKKHNLCVLRKTLFSNSSTNSYFLHVDVFFAYYLVD